MDDFIRMGGSGFCCDSLSIRRMPQAKIYYSLCDISTITISLHTAEYPSQMQMSFVAAYANANTSRQSK